MEKDDQWRLEQFFGAYFNQDWDLDAEYPASVVQLYMRDANQNEIGHLRGAILALVGSDSDNAELEERLLRDYGCYYMPSGAGLTARDWLQSIVVLLSTRLI